MTIDIHWLAPAAIVSLAPAVVQAAQYMSIEQARALIFPQAKEFVVAPLNLNMQQSSRVRDLTGQPPPTSSFKVWRAESAGTFLGWLFLHQVIGKHQYMTFVAGISPSGALVQFEIIEYRELYGYQVREPRWRAQFVGKTIADPVAIGVDIVNITTATLSCQHVAEGIRQLLAVHDAALR